ncbi:Hsp20/alpha crystallin family protein [Candidatus Kaiserbacteria bacterium]|nr:Hsp20/alpha crystallin family protein [Candidatus Kaiserbacteria bacterium]
MEVPVLPISNGMKKPSFLERLTGVKLDAAHDPDFGEDTGFEDEMGDGFGATDEHGSGMLGNDHIEQEGELPVDMYQTDDAIVIRTLVAGVSPNDLEITITRDMVTLKGSREEIHESSDDDYFHRELFWGSFSRTILLPEEVMIDEADAHEKHGMLEIILPKLDKNRSTRLSVKSQQAK